MSQEPAFPPPRPPPFPATAAVNRISQCNPRRVQQQAPFSQQAFHPQPGLARSSSRTLFAPLHTHAWRPGPGSTGRGPPALASPLLLTELQRAAASCLVQCQGGSPRLRRTDVALLAGALGRAGLMDSTLWAAVEAWLLPGQVRGGLCHNALKLGGCLRKQSHHAPFVSRETEMPSN